MNSKLHCCLFAAILFCCSIFAHGQGAVSTGPPVAVNGMGQPLAGITVAICNANPGQTPGALCGGLQLVPTFTDITDTYACTGTLTALNNQFNPTVTSGCSNPGLTDGQGNVVAFAAAGTQAWCEYQGAPLSAIVVSNCSFGGGGGGGSAISLQTNGTVNATQNVLNLASGSNINVGYSAGGTVIFSFTPPGPGSLGFLFDNAGTLTETTGAYWTPGTFTATFDNLAVTGTCTGCSTGSVASVAGTANQITASSTTGNVVLSIPSPFIPSGNVFVNQFSNGSDALTVTRNTDSSPTGTLCKYQSAGLTVLGYCDISANLYFPSFNATGSGAGFIGMSQGADNSGSLSALAIGEEAPTVVSANYMGVRPGTACLATNGCGLVYGQLTGTLSTETFNPVSGTGGNLVSTTSAMASAASGVVPITNGSGDLVPSSTSLSSLNASCAATTITKSTLCGTVNSTGLTGNLSNTNILTGFTSAAAGQYQISVYVNATAENCTGTAGSFIAKITYSDSNGAVTLTVVNMTFTTSLPNHTQGIATFWNQTTATTINVAGTYSPCSTGGMTLDTHYTLTRLQ
jgi:hypothetical protein